MCVHPVMSTFSSDVDFMGVWWWYGIADGRILSSLKGAPTNSRVPSEYMAGQLCAVGIQKEYMHG